MIRDNLFIQDFYPDVLFANKVIRINGYQIHSHKFMELTYVLSGTGDYQIQEKTYPISTGDLLIINPGTPHTSMITDPEVPLILFSICFDNFQLENMEPNHIILPDCCMHTTGQLHKDITLLCEYILDEHNRRLPGHDQMIRNHLSSMIISILRAAYAPAPKEEKAYGSPVSSYHKTYVVEYVKKYIDTYYANNEPLPELYRELYLSPNYVRKVFKEHTGYTPNHYLIVTRLRNARQILSNTPNLSVKEAAYRVGYHDVFHFSKIFKKYFGVPPTFYK